eukprot:8496240-Ditylum_brightwellii.AAC.1
MPHHSSSGGGGGSGSGNGFKIISGNSNSSPYIWNIEQLESAYTALGTTGKKRKRDNEAGSNGGVESADEIVPDDANDSDDDDKNDGEDGNEAMGGQFDDAEEDDDD